MYFSAAKAVDELGLPQTPAEAALRRRRRVVRRARLCAPRPPSPGGVNATPVRLAAHAQEPLELLLRLPLPAAPPAGGALRRVRLLPHRRRRGGHRPGPRRAAAASSSAGARRSRRSTGARPSIRRPSGCRRPCALFPIPRAALDEIIAGVEMDLDHPPTRRSRSCTRTATASPPPSGSAASRSSAIRTRGPATTRWTSASRSS